MSDFVSSLDLCIDPIFGRLFYTSWDSHCAVLHIPKLDRSKRYFVDVGLPIY